MASVQTQQSDTTQVDLNPEISSSNEPGKTSGELVAWVMDRVQRWRAARDTNYLDEWEKYYYIWRSKYNPKLANRLTERSKLIAPATQIAVDTTVAEMAEAIFGRGNWFDASADIQDPKARQIAEAVRDNLLGDFAKDNIKATVIQTLFTGAVYGTGIAKRVIGQEDLEEITYDSYGEPQTVPKKRIYVKWEAIAPHNFVIDSATTSIADAFGMAHETLTPVHTIKAKQRTGEYFAGTIGEASGYTSALLGVGVSGDTLEVDPADAVYFTEYHGKVPRYLLEGLQDKPTELDDVIAEVSVETENEKDEDDLVEAIVCIANGSTLLKAAENPILGHDRGFVAYQHNICPNRFWGIGVVEKALNSQLALDAELRARIDALGLLTYPVMGADASRLPRNLNLSVTPGKVFLVNGRPSEVLEPIKFGNLDPATFQQSGDFERMIEGATGAFNQATPVNIRARNDTAGGMSMVSAGALKRAKLAMHNVDTDYLAPMVRKTLIAYMMLVPERYPFLVSFTVNATMSIMAREYEQTQLTNLLAIIPPESPSFLLVLRAIVDNMSGPSRERILQSIEQQMQPNPQAQQMQQQLQQIQMAQLMGEVKKLEAEVSKLGADAKLATAKTMQVAKEADIADEELNIKAAEVVIKDKQATAAMIKAKQSPKSSPKPSSGS